MKGIHSTGRPRETSDNRKFKTGCY